MIELAHQRTTPQAKPALSEAAQHRLLVAALVVGDALALALGFVAASALRFYSGVGVFRAGSPSSELYVYVFALLIPAWLVVFALFHLYDEGYLLAGTREYALLFNACTVGMMLVVVFGFLAPTFVIARGWLILAWLCSFLAAGGWRFTLRRAVRRLRTRGYFLSPTLIIGTNEEGQALAEQFSHSSTSGLRLVGFVGFDRRTGSPPRTASPSPPAGVPVLGQVDDLERLIQEHHVRELVVATSALSRPTLLQVFQTFGTSPQVTMRMSSGLFEIMTTGVQVREIGYVSLFSINKVRLTGLDVFLKTALDYGLTVPGLIMLSPFLLLCALAVKLDSPGPVIYRRRVLGVGGREFDAFKFRTMHANGDEILAAHPELQAQLREDHKIKDDPRITRVGHILRKFSLDEFPQLLNVLLQQMSLVGPCMISPPELEEYGKWGMNLLTVPPGITGLWQISGRADVSYEERVQLDMNYIRNYTIWLDLQILFRTIPGVLKGKGAY